MTSIAPKTTPAAKSTRPPLLTPYTVLIDSAEQLPMTFAGPLILTDEDDVDAVCVPCPTCGSGRISVGLADADASESSLPDAYSFTTTFHTDRRIYTVQTAKKALFLGHDTQLKGDYSIAGYETPGLSGKPCVMTERKSLADAFNTFGKGRGRFVRKLEILNHTYTYAAVVIEAEWSEVLSNPPARSRLSPRSVIASVLSWQQKYPHVHWWFVPGRAMGEAVTLRILDRFWRQQNEPAKN